MAFWKDSGKELEKEVDILTDSEVEVSFGKDVEGKTEVLSEVKPIKALGAAGKKGKFGADKGKRKTFCTSTG